MKKKLRFPRSVFVVLGLTTICWLAFRDRAALNPGDVVEVPRLAGEGEPARGANARQTLPKVVATSAMRPVEDLDRGIWLRLKNPEVLATESRRVADGGVRRSRLLRVEEKYPLVVFTGTLPAGDENAPDELLTETIAQVADHVIVHPREGLAEEEFRKVVVAAGLRLGARLTPDGPFLVQIPAAGIDSVDKAITALAASGGVAYAEPDFLVHASDLIESRTDIDEVDGVARYLEAALDANTIRPPDCPVMDEASQQAAMEERLLDLPPGTRIITFDTPHFLGGQGSYNPYMEEQNMRIGSSGGVYVQGAYTTGYPNNGTYYVHPSSNNFTISHREGLPFTILALDLSEYSTVYANPLTVVFTGYKVDGSTVTQSFRTDGIIDGTGPLTDFQTFSFNASFTNLTKVVANTSLLMADNLAVIVEGQETTPPAPPEPPLVYDVTWDAPIHRVDQLTAVGGPFAPTSINFGNPMVRSQIGTMAGPAMEFNGSGYQQVRFSMANGAEAYRLEFDFHMDLPGDFVVILDGPGGIQSLTFTTDGMISASHSYLPSPGTIGTYPLRKTARIAVDVDMLEPAWEVFVNGISQYRGPFDVSKGDLSAIRFHESGNATGRAGVDNVRIFAYGAGSTLPDGPRLTVSPQSLSFPALAVGGSQTWYLTLSNRGSDSLEIESITTTGGHFRLSGNHSVNLLPGGTFSVPVEFRPQAIGSLTGSLGIVSNDPANPLFSVPLSGTGLGIPRITLDPPGLDVTMLANTTGTRNFTIGNAGQGTLKWNLALKSAGSSHEPPTDPVKTPDDSLFGSLWAMREPRSASGGIDAVHAWSITADNASSLVAVIDTGVDRAHPELQGNLWTNPGELPGNGIDDDGNGFIDDVDGWDFSNDDNDPGDGNGHGTHVAGTIAARGDNALGVAGVCWNARILPVKFLSDKGSGYTSDAVAAVNYASRMGARITNNSWGGGGFSQALYNAIQTAGQADSLFVAAAGNSNKDTDVSPHYPSGYDLDCIVSVASTDESDKLSYFSNHGAASVDLAAPGSNILSLRPGGQYGTSSGTSMATPHVAGAAALLLGRNPSLKPTLVKQLLMFGSDSLATLGGRTVSNGRLNAYRALKATVPAWLRPKLTSGTIPAGGSQTVPLALDTASLAPGSYSQMIAVSSNDPSQPVVDLPVALRVLPESSFHQWQVEHFSNDQMLQNPLELSQWNPSADPDGDQMCNLIEYISGGDPGTSEPENAPSMVRRNGENLFEFRVRETLADAEYRIEWSPDLVSSLWRTDGIAIADDSTAGMPAGVRLLRVRLTDSAAPSAFFRIVGRTTPDP
jgi:subtilisin family serine protease